MSASSSRATSFHLGVDAVDEVLIFILMGFVSSVSENILDEEGERAVT